MSNPVRKVVIVGRDAPAWLAALGLHRAFGHTGLAIEVVELASRVREVDVHCALPMLGGLHQLLGIDEDKMLNVVNGVAILGQRYSNWAGSAPPFIHAWDTQGIALEGVDFLQHWLYAREQGLPAAIEDFSLGAAAAKHGRHLVTRETVKGFSRALQGYHLGADDYAAALRNLAVKRGIVCSPAVFGAGLRDGESGDLTGVVLGDGRVVEGDLFVDASGSEAVLIEGVLGVEFEPWSQLLPCNRMLAASAARFASLPAFSQISAFHAGWFGIYPLRDRTALVTLWDGRETSDAEMLETAAQLSGLRIGDGAVADAIRPGRRKSAWVRNCVALGDAAVTLEPLDAAPLHVAHLGVSGLINLFPVDRAAMPEARAYNRVLERSAENLRDFQIAHYALNGRLDERFWDRAREAELPESLRYKIELFKARGRVALYDDETFEESNWVSIFIGHGLTPRSYTPLVGLCPEGDRIVKFKSMLSFIRSEVEQMPTIDAYLEFH
jgi:tryptophan halogenase